MIPEHIIKFAIEGGWKDIRPVVTSEDFAKMEQINVLQTFMNQNYNHQLICDPLFWQALGKANGWSDRKHVEKTPMGQSITVVHEDGWFFNARTFFNLLMTNGDTSKFWDSITSLNKTI